MLNAVIEGFYGRNWDWQQRRRLIDDLLLGSCYQGYIYAPKSDSNLRNGWRLPWPEQEWQPLEQLAYYYRDRRQSFGIGFSPLHLAENYPAWRPELLTKIQQLNELPLRWLAILFDDMPGNSTQLATNQLAIVDTIASYSNAEQILLCPTYYSFDPVLDEVFGQRPANYWAELSAGLDPAIAVFWTGEKVISETLASQELQRAAEVLRRKPLLWDNRLANDGRKTSHLLRLQPVSGARSRVISSYTNGLVNNPMNQYALSCFALQAQSQSLLNSDNCGLGEDWHWQELPWNKLPSGLAVLLQRDAKRFSTDGLIAFNDEQRQLLRLEYQQFHHPVAIDVDYWLAGHYDFDPACLTG